MIELRRQRLVVRQHQRRPVGASMTLAMVKVLPEPVTPSSTWCCSPSLDAPHQLLDSVTLVPLRRVSLEMSLKSIKSLGL